MALSVNLAQINAAAKGNSDLRETLTGIHLALQSLYAQTGTTPADDQPAPTATEVQAMLVESLARYRRVLADDRRVAGEAHGASLREISDAMGYGIFDERLEPPEKKPAVSFAYTNSIRSSWLRSRHRKLPILSWRH